MYAVIDFLRLAPGDQFYRSRRRDATLFSRRSRVNHQRSLWPSGQVARFLAFGGGGNKDPAMFEKVPDRDQMDAAIAILACHGGDVAALQELLEFCVECLRRHFLFRGARLYSQEMIPF